MSDKITMKKQESHEESKLIADWSAHWHIVRLEEFGVELDTTHCSPCVGTHLDQPVKSYQSIHFTSMKNTHCLLNHCSIDGVIQFQHMKSQIEAVQLQLKLAEEKAVVEIRRAQSEVEHLNKLFQTEQKDLKAQLDIQAKLLADNDVLQCNLENAHLEIDKLRIKLETEERSKIDLKTRLELQGKLLADHGDNLSNAQLEIEKLKNKLEVGERAKMDLKSQLELQGKLLEDQSILQKRVEKAEWEVGELKYTLEVEGRTKTDLKSQLEKLQYCLQVDERSKIDLKREIDRQEKLLMDQNRFQKSLYNAQLEIQQVKRCDEKQVMDNQDDQEMVLINSDISMEVDVGVTEPKTLFDPQMDPKTQNQKSIPLYRIFAEDINDRKLHIYAGKLSVKLKSNASSNSLKEAFLTGIKDSMKASKKTISKPDYRFNSAQQLIQTNHKPMNNHFLNKKERNRRCFHTHMTNNISNTLKN